MFQLYIYINYFIFIRKLIHLEVYIRITLIAHLFEVVIHNTDI